MKKFLTFITVAFVAVAASAQFRWAPIIGYNNSNFSFNQDDLISTSSASGFRAGVTGEMMFPGIGFGIDLGAMYSMEGARVNFNDLTVWATDGYTRGRVYLNYLEIPINLKFKWTRMGGVEDYVAPYLYGGPVFSFLLGHSKLPAFNYKFMTVGLQIGFGLEILKRWHVQATYNWGMSASVVSKKLDDYKADNRTLSISVMRYF